MPLFVARLSSGMCLIGEAETEQNAWSDFLRRDHPEDLGPADKIISVRRIPDNLFLSRWYPETGLLDPDALPGKPAGYLVETCEEDLLHNEYQIIACAHQHAREEVPLLLPEDLHDPDPGLFFLIEAWITNLTRRLRQAVELEMERYRSDETNSMKGMDSDSRMS